MSKLNWFSIVELEAAVEASRMQAKTLTEGPARRSVLSDALRYEEQIRLQRAALPSGDAG